MRRRNLLAAGALALAASSFLLPRAKAAKGHGETQELAVPPDPSPGALDAAAPVLGNPINTPVTGAGQLDAIVGGERPPSLEALQDVRPGDQPKDDLKPGRAATLRAAALIYGAHGGLAARAFAINEMLRTHEAENDRVFDFRPLVLSVGGGQTLLRPPIVSQAQMAFALGENGQVARETNCVYEITREAQLTSAPPNWRSYLVRTWSVPRRPAEASLPQTKAEVVYWNKWVAEGWAAGEKQAVEIFLDDLGRLTRDITGMARYRVLLRAGRVEEPRVAFTNTAVLGGRDTLHLGDRVTRIVDQPGLQPKLRQMPADCQ